MRENIYNFIFVNRLWWIENICFEILETDSDLLLNEVLEGVEVAVGRGQGCLFAGFLEKP